MRAYTHGGLAAPTASQHNIFDSEKVSQNVLVLLAGVRTSGLWISSSTLYQWSHPDTLPVCVLYKSKCPWWAHPRLLCFGPESRPLNVFQHLVKNWILAANGACIILPLVAVPFEG